MNKLKPSTSTCSAGILPPSVKVCIQSLKHVNMRGFVQNVVEQEQIKRDAVLYEENYRGCINELKTNDAFIGAFLAAYNGHGTLKISPNDIWVIILMYLSEYRNLGCSSNEANAHYHSTEPLTSPKINLCSESETNPDSNSNNTNDSDSDDSNDSDPNTLTIFDLSQKNETLLDPKNQTILINLVVNKIRNFLTVPLLADKILSQFTPSNYHTCKHFHKCAAATSLLNVIKISPQKKLRNSSNINIPNINGGVNNVIFEGTVWDWIKLSDKVRELKIYDTGDKRLITYIKRVSDILNQFIDSINGNVNVDFWNTMFQPKYLFRLKSQLVFGSSSHISGWILHFYGIYSSIPYASLPTRHSCIPIHLMCPNTHTLKQMLLTTGFSGICKLNHNTFAPRLYTKIVLLESIYLTKTPPQVKTCKFEVEDILINSELKLAIEEYNNKKETESENEPNIGLKTRFLSFLGF